MSLPKLTGVQAALLALTAILAIAAGYFIGMPVGRNQAVALVSAPGDAVRQLFVPDAPKLFGKNSIRVLLVGLDYDYDAKDQEFSKNSRSDIIMALNVDFANHRISELSVPRDMVATMPNGRLAKINQAQSDGGIRESQSVIAQWLGIPGFDRYIVLRINTAKDVVNAIGGVDVDVKNANALRGTGPNGPLDYDDHWGHLSIHFKPVRTHMNGDQAVAYARFRHDWCSDPCRIMRQQQMIHAVLDKIEHNQFNTIAHAQALLGVVHNDVETNFTTQEQLSTAVAFAHLAPKNIETAQVPYVRNIDLPDYGDALVPDEPAKAHLVATMLAPRDDIASASAGSTLAAKIIRVRVENGTHVPGLAAKVALDLRNNGFTVTEVGDAPSHDVSVTQIESNPANASASERVRAALGHNATAAVLISNATPTLSGESDVTVVLGHDIVATQP
ncbi:MAG: hypothetical protein NVS2B17_03310 [Candidatus Velthaea sp.]